MKINGLDALGNPKIKLPDDLGDGPFWTTAPESSASLPEMAKTTTRFERKSAFEETLLTDNKIIGPSSRVIVGQIHISDKIGPSSFRRVHQHFSLRHVGEISGYPLIVFNGDPGAIIREEMGHFKPNKPATGNDLLNGARPGRGNVPEARAAAILPDSIRHGNLIKRLKIL